jgi:hypothetical protein
MYFIKEENKFNVSIAILEVIHRLVFHLKHNVSEAIFCILFQVKPTPLGPILRT